MRRHADCIRAEVAFRASEAPDDMNRRAMMQFGLYIGMIVALHTPEQAAIAIEEVRSAGRALEGMEHVAHSLLERFAELREVAGG